MKNKHIRTFRFPNILKNSNLGFLEIISVNISHERDFSQLEVDYIRYFLVLWLSKINTNSIYKKECESDSVQLLSDLEIYMKALECSESAGLHRYNFFYGDEYIGSISVDKKEVIVYQQTYCLGDKPDVVLFVIKRLLELHNTHSFNDIVENLKNEEKSTTNIILESKVTGDKPFNRNYQKVIFKKDVCIKIKLGKLHYSLFPPSQYLPSLGTNIHESLRVGLVNTYYLASQFIKTLNTLLGELKSKTILSVVNQTNSSIEFVLEDGELYSLSIEAERAK